MKYSCELIKDLLPLYQDEVCSEESAEIIEEHLKQCPECRKLAASMKIDFRISEPEVKRDGAALKKCFTLIRKRFLLILLVIVLSLPLLTVTLRLTVNQLRKEGICFTNIDDYLKASSFVKDIQKGNFREAFSRIDRTGDYESIVSAAEIDENDPDTSDEDIERKKYVYETYPEELSMTYEEFAADRTEKAVSLFEEYRASGGSLSFSECIDKYVYGDSWAFEYRVSAPAPDGSETIHYWTVIVGKDGIFLAFHSYEENSFLDDLWNCL